MASSSNHGSNSSSSSDDKIFEQLFVDMDRQKQCAFACAIVMLNSSDMFNANEFEEDAS
jgi:hypothetical protein